MLRRPPQHLRHGSSALGGGSAHDYSEFAFNGKVPDGSRAAGGGGNLCRSQIDKSHVNIADANPVIPLQLQAIRRQRAVIDGEDNVCRRTGFGMHQKKTVRAAIDDGNQLTAAANMGRRFVQR